MKLPGLLAVVGIALTVGACATAPHAHPTTDIYLSPGVTKIALDEGKVNLKQDRRVICNVVRPTGTNIPVTYCTTVAEAAKRRAKIQQMLLLATSNTHSN